MACRSLALAVLSVVGLWSLPSAAADTPVALDLHYVAPLSPDSPAFDGGAGIAGRIGQRFKSLPWLFTPELQVAYETFGGAAETRLYRGLGGLRLAYDSIVRPGIFLHGGVGKSSFVIPPGADHTAFTFDGGAFVDLTLLPLVNVGAHLSYNQMLEGNNANNGLKWLAIGLHAELVL